MLRYLFLDFDEKFKRLVNKNEGVSQRNLSEYQTTIVILIQKLYFCYHAVKIVFLYHTKTTKTTKIFNFTQT
jgi:hypothetical protein